MTAETASVDIVIAVRNEAKLLGDCLESLCAQDYDSSRVRILVVDNGSTDSTGSVASGYAVELLRESKDGPAAARNRGIESGTSDLVAFLDGHCIANPGWIASMANRFSDPSVGGCQARIENRATDGRVADYIEATGMNDNNVVLEATVRGERNIYPWILSGNCMFRRSAIEYAGGFDESLPACEDVDLSWRVVLSGYRLDYAESASVIHWNGDDWDAFVRKSWRQGRGAAALANRYLQAGAPNVFAPVRVPDARRDRAEVAREYEAGYRYEEERIISGAAPSTRIGQPRIDRRLRTPFAWTSETSLGVSLDVVYWLNGDFESVIVHQPSRSRIVLDDTADLIWRRLARGMHREILVGEIVGRYGIAADVAGSDCDDLVQELIDIGALIRV